MSGLVELGRRPMPPATVPRTVAFRPFLAGDIVQLALQPSQHVTLGMTRPVHGLEDGIDLAASGPAWTAIGGGRILCCAGFQFLWPPREGFGGHAVAWAMLACGLGGAHLAITRFARGRIEDSSIPRIEAVVRADVSAECKWARLVGLNFRAQLLRWGPDGETHLLFDRIKDAPHQSQGGFEAPPEPRVREMA